MRLTRFVTAVLISLTGLVAVAAPRASAAPPPFVDAAGVHVVSATQLDERLWALSVAAPSLGRAVRLRILLPTGYADHPDARYPVLYLFHGTSGGADDWVTQGDAEATTANRPLVVVMPDAGFDDDGGGWFTNWVDTHTGLGPSQWETFHVDQLVPWVDANVRTVAARAGRAIAGLSQGGFGAMSYAARHPDLFGVAASFSGAPDIDRDLLAVPFSTAVIEGTALYLDGVQPEAMFGSRLTNEINWAGHDPANLIGNLRGTSLFMWTASGLPGQYDTGAPDLQAIGVEAITHASTQMFHQHLQEAGIASYYDDYVFGTHTFPYWARDLREFIGPLMDALAHPLSTAAVTYRTVDTAWTQWGWTVVNHRPQPQAWGELSGADGHGFTLSGFGTADVTTPAAYVPGSAHPVTVGSRTGVATADAAGRLHVSVPLTSGLLVLGAGKVRVSIG